MLLRSWNEGTHRLFSLCVFAMPKALGGVWFVGHSSMF